MNYGEFKAAVLGYSQRADMAALLPTFLALAEQRIYIGEQSTDPLRLLSMIKSASSVDGSLPADYLEMIRVGGNMSSGLVPLGFLSLEEIGDSSGGFSYLGQSVVVSQDVAMPLSLVYYGRFTALSTDDSTNWILTNAPNLYLSGVLIEIARYTQDDTMLQKEVGNFTSASNALREADQQSRYSGAVLQLGTERGGVV